MAHLLNNSIMKKQAAFTLVELFVAIAVLGILLAVALPQMRYALLSNQITSKTNGLVRSLNYARNESVVKGYKCDGSGTQLFLRSLSGTSNWSDGWTLVLVDENGNVEEIRAFQFEDAITVMASEEIAQLSYCGRGQANINNPVLFEICYDADDFTIGGRRIEIEYTGRVSLRDRDYECGANG